jgi:TolA-binding protein
MSDPKEKECLQEGIQLFRQGKLEAAEDSFRSFIDRYPESDLADNACYNLASIFVKQQNFWKALEWMDFLLTNYPDSDAAQVAGDEKLEIMRELKIGPKEMPYEVYLKGKLLLGEKKLEQAEETFKDFIRRYPTSDLIDNAHYNLAVIYRHRGNLAQVREHVQIIMSEHPDSDAALYAEDLLAS